MLVQHLTQKLKEAVMARDEFNATLVRGLLAALHNREIELRPSGKELSEEDAVAVLRRELKKRKESSQLYRQGGRVDLAEKEEKEATFIESLVPAMMSRDELERVVDDVIKDTGASGAKDFGPVMKETMTRCGGRAEGKEASAVIKERLSS
jgi:hypothetical protein